MNKNEIKKKCLLLCATPLQALIAEKIIQKNPNAIFFLVFTDHDYENKTKFLYYFNRLKSQCAQSMYWTDHYGLKNFLKFRIQLRKSGLDIKYDEIYLANLERKHFSYFISKNSQADLFTFDDGMGNINKSTHFHSNQRPSFIKRLIWRTLGVKYFIPDLRHLSKLHYTIYKNLPNIIGKTEYIALYNDDENLLPSFNQSNKVVKFYLGQPLEPINPKFNKEYIINILQKLEIDYYFPHPREVKESFSGFEIIESHLIFEDYIIKYLKDNPNTEVYVYSLISGVLLNINKLDRVHVKYIYDNFLQESYQEFYSLVKEEFNIDIIKI